MFAASALVIPLQMEHDVWHSRLFLRTLHAIQECPVRCLELRSTSCGRAHRFDWEAVTVMEITRPDSFVNKTWNPLSSNKLLLRVTDYMAPFRKGNGFLKQRKHDSLIFSRWHLIFKDLNTVELCQQKQKDVSYIMKKLLICKPLPPGWP